MPVPVRVTAGEFDALLANVTAAKAVPADCGVKVIVREAFWPMPSVSGNVTPLTVNSGLLTDAEETVTLAPPALSVAVLFWLAPTTTFPKSAPTGEAVSWPWLVAVPDSETLRFVLVAFDTAEMLPVAEPAKVGAKATVKVMLSPEPKVCGRSNPLTLNPAPETVA